MEEGSEPLFPQQRSGSGIPRCPFFSLWGKKQTLFNYQSNLAFVFWPPNEETSSLNHWSLGYTSTLGITNSILSDPLPTRPMRTQAYQTNPAP